MEVKLDKRYPLAVGAEQAWLVLGDIRAVARCMPGAQVTDQVDDTHYKGTVKTKVGPAVVHFGGDIELRLIDAATRSLHLYAKGADKSGSSAAMDLAARLEDGEAAGTAVLVGQATVTVSGKLAQFGSRLLVPVSDAMLAQFADNFRAAAAALPPPAGAASASSPPAGAIVESAAGGAGDAAAGKPAVEPERGPGPASAPNAEASAAAARMPVQELNVLALAWSIVKAWFARRFGGKG